MAGTPAFYIVTVAGGKCLENTQGPHGVLDCVPKESDSQKWILETSEDDPNVVAIKSCTDGKYLINTQPHAISGARIGMSNERQQWTLEKGRFPRSCFIRSNACTAGASYLNDFNGEYVDNHYVHMWQMEKTLDWWLTWYLVDTKTSAAFNPAQTQVSNDASGEELETRERAVAEKEQSIDEKEKANEEREAALKKREEKVAAQEASLRKQAATADSQSTAGKDVAKSGGATKPDNNASAKTAGAGAKDSNGAGTHNHDLDLLKAENENLKLRLRIKDLESQLERAKQRPAPSVSAAHASSTPSSKANAPNGGPATSRVKSGASPNGTSSEQVNGRPNPPSKANTSKPLSKQNDNDATTLHNAAKAKKAVVFTCGHVAYPPPRKVEKKIVGILYEGMDQPHQFSARQQAALAKAGL